MGVYSSRRQPVSFFWLWRLKEEVRCTLITGKGSHRVLLQTTFTEKCFGKTHLSLCSMKNKQLNTSGPTNWGVKKSSQVDKVRTWTCFPVDTLARCEAKDGERDEQIWFDISQSSGKWRGYILSHTMSQPLMGQRSDALISLIDGLEAYNSPQREDDQENAGEGEEPE